MRLLALVLLASLTLPLQAQEATTTAHLTDWPLSAHTERVSDRHWRGLDVLPFIERMSLSLAVADADAFPDVSARVTWQMGREGIKHGRRVRASALPQGVRMVAFVLRADVVQQGERVAGFTLAVDSTRLPAGEVLLLQPSAVWDVLFDEVDAATARRIVQEGFSLDNLRLVRAAFGVFGPETSSDATGAGREQVLDRSVYDAYPDVWINVAWDLAWLFAPDPYAGRSADRALAPRGKTGRASARGERGSRSDDEQKKEDEKDESGELLPAAAMVGAALVAGAVVSGSAGYMVQADEPIGFASGFIRRRGGIVLQASANAAALGMRAGDESLTAQVIGFYGPAWQIVQPAVGLGLRYHEEQGAMRTDAAVTLGGVFRLGRASLLAGYELVGQRPSAGLIYSWKMR